jgi:hypothetical protein
MYATAAALGAFAADAEAEAEAAGDVAWRARPGPCAAAVSADPSHAAQAAIRVRREGRIVSLPRPCLVAALQRRT